MTGILIFGNHLNSVDGQLTEDATDRQLVSIAPAIDRFLKPGFEAKNTVNEAVGLNFGSITAFRFKALLRSETFHLDRCR